MKAITIKNRTVILNLAALMICLFMGNNMRAQTATASEIIGELTFESEMIDYGTIAHNADGERTFKFENTGDAPVVISKVKTSCGCTVPTYPKKAILPGEKGDIKVKYATNRIGAFSKTITVMSNASESSKMLKIKGNVLSDTASEAN